MLYFRVEMLHSFYSYRISGWFAKVDIFCSQGVFFLVLINSSDELKQLDCLETIGIVKIQLELVNPLTKQYLITTLRIICIS